MKNTLRIISSASIICLLTFSIAIGQDKKSEQKIKIVVIDDSGKKTEIDTLITGNDKIDSVIMKDGKVVHVKDMEGGTDIHPGCKEQVTVTVTTDGKEVRKNIKCIDKDGNCKGEKLIVSCDNKCIGKEEGQSFRYRTKSDNKEPEGEKTKYVIKRDGMVISVEGDDYNKVKELVKDIENKLDTKSNNTDQGAPAKENTKKAVSKK